ncbi:MAG TPA: hypothetical protein VGC89_09260 [Pyrinomonadaceae bacterium]|jgi:hypothetical protein
MAYTVMRRVASQKYFMARRTIERFSLGSALEFSLGSALEQRLDKLGLPHRITTL